MVSIFLNTRLNQIKGIFFATRFFCKLALISAKYLGEIFLLQAKKA